MIDQEPRRTSPRTHTTALLVLLLLIPSGTAGAAADPYPRDPDLDILHYVFRLSLSDAEDIVRGRTTLKVRFLRAGKSSFVLDLVGTRPGSGDRSERGMRVQEVTGPGGPVRFSHSDDRLTVHLEGAAEAGEERIYTVVYSGIPADGLIISRSKYGERTFFGDNWPDRARHWLPAVDHPSDKATCEFIVTAPAHYRVIGSGELVGEEEVGTDLRRTHWRTRAPLATKLMVIGAAEFAVVDLGEARGIPQQAWTYEQDRAAGAESFSVSPRILDFYARRIGPFAYAKLAHVQSKTRYGGMENAGNIFYHEGRGETPGWSEGLIAHEMAHQWFGDAVSEADWHHIWLSEGFATYFTSVYMEHTYGHRRLIEEMGRDRRRVIRAWRQRPASSVVDTTLAIGGDLLSTNTYQKGAWVLHMLRHRVGETDWWEGIRTYYRRFMNGNALTSDFHAVMEEVSGEELDRFFHQWLRLPGHPVIEWSWRWEEPSGTLRISVRQVQESGNIFRFPLEVGIAEDPSQPLQIVTLQVDGPEGSFSIPRERAPRYVCLDPHVWLLMEASRVRD
ncbi:MAG: M1 family metallopeptidase [bacterium]